MKKYKKGILEVLESFEEYAREVLPEAIYEKAVPETATIKRLYAKDVIASEPRCYPRQVKIT